MSKKIKFLEDEMIFDSDSTTKSILANRVDEIKLGYEQEKAEPKKVLPNTNFLGIPDKFKAYINEVGGSEYIGSPSFSAGKEEISAFYLGGTFIANTCEKMLTQDPRTVLEIPDSVEDVLKNLNLSIMVDDLKMKCIVPLENIEGWGDTDVSTWEKPIDPASIGQEEVKVIEGNWIVLNGGAVYKGDMQSNLIIKFVPEDLEDFQEIVIDLKPEVSDEPPPDLLTKLYQHWGFESTTQMSRLYYNSSISGGLQLTSTNNPSVTQVDGLLNKAGNYSTGSEDCYCGFTDGLFYSNNSFSLAAWVKLGDTTNQFMTPIIRIPEIKWKNKTYWYELIIGSTVDGNNICIGISDTSVPYEMSDTLEQSLKDTWSLIIVTYEKETETLIVYVNNKQVLESVGDIHPDNRSTQFTLGGYFSNNAFKGQIDDVAIWTNKILTKKEKKMLYNNGSGLPFEDYV